MGREGRGGDVALTGTPLVDSLPTAVRAEWRSLAAPTPVPVIFDPDAVAALPAAARRWCTHAIAPGTPLLRTVELHMHGEIKLGSWRPFDAVQILAPPLGFIWAARTRIGPLVVRGFDRFSNGTGEMRWRPST